MHKFFRELFGLFMIFVAILLTLGLLSFNANDPSFNFVHSEKREIQNLAGLFGAYTAGFLNDIMGVCALLWPLVFAFLGIAYLSSRFVVHWWRWCGLFLLTICGLIFTSAFDLSLGDLSGGGMVGDTLYKNGIIYLSAFGTCIILLFLFLIGLQLLLNFSWTSIISHVYQWMSDKFFSHNVREKMTQFLKRAKILRECWPKQFPAFITKLKIPTFTVPGTFLTRPFLFFKKFINQKEPVSPVLHSENMNLNRAEVNTYPDIVIIPQEQQENTQYQEYDSPLISNEHTPGRSKQTYSDEHLSSTQAEYEEDTDNEDNFLLSPQKDTDIKLFKPEPVIHPLPPVDLLQPPSPMTPASIENLKARGRDLMASFNDFGIQGELVRITPGPVITMFEVKPAAGVRVSKITNLCDDLSLALKAVSVRIQTVLGSNTVGIEIPNDSRETVNFRELVESPEFQENNGALTIILGKTISGKPYCTDLSKMPHLLVGGTTGAGKSVSLNAMLISLLYQYQPSELKLLLVDPKRVEMSVYADLPHLVHPVVTEMNDAKAALEWAIHEMYRRFDIINRLGVKNVPTYNQRLAAYKDSLPPELSDLEPIPYLVIVIDELADLMMTAAREVESSIQRLLQLARAAAIHLILATQRPSVDVVTGVLKANLNCRVAFKVISRHDSRTILDEIGAEQLLGRGDMLFKPPTGALQRLHAPFLRDDEIQAVVNYWKEKEKPIYNIDFSKWSPNKTASSSAGGDETDVLYEEAKAFVLEQGRGSISLLQRHLKIGYNRSARIIEQMEKDGIITAADGSKPRTVIRN